MKKLIMLLLTLTLILGVFASCNKRYLYIEDETSSSPSEDASEESTTDITETTSETNYIERITTKVITEDTIPDIDSKETTAITDEETRYYSGWIPGQDLPFNYSSYNELVNSLDNEKSRIILEKEKWGVRFSKFIDALSERKSVPLFNGQIPPNNGGDQIVIFPTDSYSLPWIWYHCDYNDRPMVIHITYPDEILEKDFSKFTSTSEVLREISSTAPNIHNADEKKDTFKNIYEKELIIEGKTVSALITEPINAYHSYYVHFYYNGVYVYIRSYPEVFTDEFWQGFSIE